MFCSFHFLYSSHKICFLQSIFPKLTSFPAVSAPEKTQNGFCVTWSLISWDKDHAFWMNHLSCRASCMCLGIYKLHIDVTCNLASAYGGGWMGNRLESLNRLWPFPPGGQWLNLAQGNSNKIPNKKQLEGGGRRERGKGKEHILN